MLILTIRTDKPEAELGLFDDQKKLVYEVWPAHRELSVTIHKKIERLLVSQDKRYTNIEGIVCFAGPGSFTGLRIGLTVANAFAYGLRVPIIATKNEDWVQLGVQQLIAGWQGKIALPEYGSPVHITVPRK